MKFRFNTAYIPIIGLFWHKYPLVNDDGDELMWLIYHLITTLPLCVLIFAAVFQYCMGNWTPFN